MSTTDDTLAWLESLILKTPLSDKEKAASPDFAAFQAILAEILSRHVKLHKLSDEELFARAHVYMLAMLLSDLDVLRRSVASIEYDINAMREAQGFNGR